MLRLWRSPSLMALRARCGSDQELPHPHSLSKGAAGCGRPSSDIYSSVRLTMLRSDRSPHDMRTGSNRNVSRQLAVEAVCYFGQTEIFYVMKTLAPQKLHQFARIEQAEPGLTSRRGLCCGCDNVGAAVSRIILKRLRIVEENDSFRNLGDEFQCGQDGVLRQIWHDTKPLEKRRLVRPKPYSRQAFGEAFSLEVDGRKDERWRLNEACCPYPVARTCRGQHREPRLAARRTRHKLRSHPPKNGFALR